MAKAFRKRRAEKRAEKERLEKIKRKIREEKEKERAEKRVMEKRVAKMKELLRIINEARAKGTSTETIERMFEMTRGHFDKRQYRRFEDMAVQIKIKVQEEAPARKEVIKKEEITTRGKIDRLMAGKLDNIIEELGVPNTKDWRIKIAKMGVMKLPKKDAVRKVREELERKEPLVKKIKKPEGLSDISVLKREWEVLERKKKLDEEKIDLFRRAVQLKDRIMTEDLSAEEHGSAMKKYRLLLGEILDLKK